MKIELRPVTADQLETLDNLMEKYLYEFSQYDMIPFDEGGLYNDPYIDRYLTEKDRYAYFIRVDGKLAGLVLINKHAECPAPLDWSIAEFFVAYPYRRKGVGTFVMKQLFEQFKGVWHIKYHPKNVGSEIFWHKIASDASGGKFDIMRGDHDYYDGTPAKVLVFRV